MEGPLTQRGTDLAMSHGKMVRSKSYIYNATVTNTESAELTARDLGGLLSEPIVLDTSLMGDVVVTLHVAGDSVVSTCSANPTTPLIFSANKAARASPLAAGRQQSGSRCALLSLVANC
jgi:hypothetical protein